ncbi:MAG: hypothetical protein KDB14_05520 [Planctomycetales bacterium]|nr:hypothetical protein [Planctomycetales bacterium]
MHPNDQLFDPENFHGTPLLAAIEQMAGETGHTLDELRQLKMRDLVAMARSHYEVLPEIWQIWVDWNEDDTPQPMGDL